MNGRIDTYIFFNYENPFDTLAVDRLYRSSCRQWRSLDGQSDMKQETNTSLDRLYEPHLQWRDQPLYRRGGKCREDLRRPLSRMQPSLISSVQQRRHLTYNVQVITLDIERKGKVIHQLIHRSLLRKEALVLVEDVPIPPR
jgi:hypothetical protein